MNIIILTSNKFLLIFAYYFISQFLVLFFINTKVDFLDNQNILKIIVKLYI